MKYRKMVISFITIFSIAGVASGETNIFPQNNFMPGWKGGMIEEYNTPEDLFIYMNGGAELYLEYRFVGLEVREYSHPENGTLSIEIYRFATPEDSYGIFSIDTSGAETDIGQGARATAVSVRFWKDRTFVRTFLWQFSPELVEVPITAARMIAEKIDRSGELPEWLQTLDTEALNPSFVRGEIALRQVAGSSLPEHLPIKHRTGAAWVSSPGGEMPGCLILKYDTESKALQSFQSIWNQISSEDGSSVLVGRRGIVITPTKTATGIENLGHSILLVPSAEDEASCAETLDKIGSILSGKEG